MKTAAILVAATQCFAAADHALRAGVSLERAQRGYPSAFEALIDEVYRSEKAEDAFRRDWFLDCIDSHR